MQVELLLLFTCKKANQHQLLDSQTDKKQIKLKVRIYSQTRRKAVAHYVSRRLQGGTLHQFAYYYCKKRMCKYGYKLYI